MLDQDATALGTTATTEEEPYACVRRDLALPEGFTREVLHTLFHRGVSAAARALGVSERTLRRRLQGHGLGVSTLKRAIRDRLEPALHGKPTADHVRALGFTHVESYRRYRRAKARQLTTSAHPSNEAPASGVGSPTTANHQNAWTSDDEPADTP